MYRIFSHRNTEFISKNGEKIISYKIKIVVQPLKSQFYKREISDCTNTIFLLTHFLIISLLCTCYIDLLTVFIVENARMNVNVFAI